MKMNQESSQSDFISASYKDRAPLLPTKVDNAKTDLLLASLVTRTPMKVNCILATFWRQLLT